MSETSGLTRPSREEQVIRRPRAALLMAPPALAEHLFGPGASSLAPMLDVGAPVASLSDDVWSWLPRSELLITGWGAPRLAASDLDRMPDLRAIFHAGGSVSAVADVDELARRGIACSNAGMSNAVPVAEYTVAMILLAGRDVWRALSLYRERRSAIDREEEFIAAGSYGRTVGIVGASRTGRKVIELLRATDSTLLLYDPHVSQAEATELGVTALPLHDVAAASDVLTIHAPDLPQTRGMIDAAVIARLRPGATLINTARGRLVDHDALGRRLRRGDLTAVLDVTSPEPLPPDHELWDMPNVVLTPHIAGAMGSDLRRLGDQLVGEIDRFRRSEPLRYAEV